MAKRDEIAKFLNKELNVRKIKDSSKNGLQSKGNTEIKRIAFAVDACIEVFEKAKKQNCNMIIVHHGMKWKPQKYQNELNTRMNYLKKNKISLYGAHLPLDTHKKYGNNAELCRILKVEKLKPFGKYHGPALGYSGIFKKEITIKQLINIISKELKTKPVVLNFGKEKIKSIGIVSGGGVYALEEAIKKKLDCFMTGETSHSSYHYAKEAGINLIFSGHYATETLGVKALMPVLKKKFEVETVFIDVPTGL